MYCFSALSDPGGIREGRLVLISGLGSIVGPLIGTSVMARFSIDGLLYFMAAAALLFAPVMVCDLVGSTSLAATLDAEDWRNLVNAYLDQASAAVTHFGGHVLKDSATG